ncbi:MAG: Gfo/Idh/MocA family oxidoreductase [Rhodoglobus sp.]
MSLPRSLPASTAYPLRGGPVLRWGVLAPGVIAGDWVETVHANTDQRVVAVASRTRSRAEAFAATHGIERVHEHYEALVGDPGVDVVYIAAPHTEHHRLALLAISAGKHVLIEKPIAVTEREAAEIADAARAAGVFAMEAMWSRFLPQTTVIATLLRDGVLGAPRLVTADFGGRFDFDPHGRAFNPALSGGSMLDLGVYSLWFTTFVLGEPAGVTARGSLAVTGVDEQATVLLDYGNALGVASSSMVVDTAVTAVVNGQDARLEVDGPFCAPGGFRLVAGDEQLRYDDPNAFTWRAGLCYQATAVAAHVAAGLTEAPEHPLCASLRVLRIIDEARRQLGYRFAGEA